MEFLHFTSVVALGLLFISGLSLCDDGNVGSVDGTPDDPISANDQCVNMDAIMDLVKDLEEEMDNPAALMNIKDKDNTAEGKRSKRSIRYNGYQGYGGFNQFGGYPGYNGFNQYRYPFLGGSRNLPWLGGYGGYGYREYAYTNTRLQSFIHSFSPANYQVENNCNRYAAYEALVYTRYYGQVSDNCVVHNFYKRGTYTTAKTEYLALPFVRVVPVTSVKSIDYVGLINRGCSYTATLCSSCHRGYPQIELRCNTRPFQHIVRRFTFLPETSRQQVHYGASRDYAVQGGIGNGPVGMGLGPAGGMGLGPAGGIGLGPAGGIGLGPVGGIGLGQGGGIGGMVNAPGP